MFSDSPTGQFLYAFGSLTPVTFLALVAVRIWPDLPARWRRWLAWTVAALGLQAVNWAVATFVDHDLRLLRIAITTLAVVIVGSVAVDVWRWQRRLRAEARATARAAAWCAPSELDAR